MAKYKCACGKVIEADTNGVIICTYRRKLSPATELIKHSKEVCVERTNLDRLISKIPKNSTTGIKGVRFDIRKNKYQAYITFQYRRYHLGYYYSIDDAKKARAQAEIKLFEPILNKYGRTINAT